MDIPSNLLHTSLCPSLFLGNSAAQMLTNGRLKHTYIYTYIEHTYIYLFICTYIPPVASLVVQRLKKLPVNAGDPGSIPGSGRSPGKRNGNPLQYSCLEKFHGQKSLVGSSPWGHKEADMIELLSMAQPACCRMFSNTPGFYPLDATSASFYQL